jgi:hypothetical protein
MSNCYWILTSGRIVIPDSLHILVVVSAPALFGESEESIQETFRKSEQDMRSNYEGKAREEVLLRVINRNNIRIRKNILKRQQHWSIQLYRLTAERKSSLSAWAKYMHGLSGDKYADVTIHQLYDDSKMRTSLDQLLAESAVDEDPVILKQSDLVGNYK